MINKQNNLTTITFTNYFENDIHDKQTKQSYNNNFY